MAIQKGIIKLVGTIDGINFYQRKGKAVARKGGGGFTGKAIKSSPNMVRVRENSSEFGECSKVKKGIRIAMNVFLSNLSDGTLHGRMMSLFQTIKELDGQSLRGERKVGKGIVTVKGRQLFKEFNFTPKCRIPLVVPMCGSYEQATFTYQVSEFDIERVMFPKGSNLLEVQYGVLEMNFEMGDFKMYMAPPIELEPHVIVDGFSMTPTELPSMDLVCFAFVGICFYQVLNGEKYLFKDEGSVGIVCVG